MNYVSFHRSIFSKILRKIYRYSSDKLYIESAAAAELGYRINLTNPQTYNEKLAWIKLYDHNPLYHRMVDKYEVKSIVDDIIGPGHTAKCLAIFDSYQDVDLNKFTPPMSLKVYITASRLS